MKTDQKIFFVIFLCSFSSLAYEIALTRIFSVSLWYHFAFMIISIAMLGIGASGTVLSLYRNLRNISNIKLYSLFLGIGIITSYLISNQIPFDPVRFSWDKIQLFYIGLYYIILSIPFFFTGLIIATAFSCMSEKTGLVYGSDLLGAGTGSLGIMYLMTIMTPDKTVFILSSIVLIGSFVISEKRLKVISLSFILVNFSILLFQPSFTNIRMSPYKGLQVALRYPGAEHLKTYFSPFSRIDTFISTAVRFAPGLSFKYLDPLPEQIGFSTDGSEINAITSVHGANYVSPTSSLRFLSFLPLALPYEIRNPSLPPFHSQLTKGGYRGVKRVRGELTGIRFLPYFAFLGIGFMFVEISLIQKIILPLENPSYAVATVLTSILISSGIGSLLSQRVTGLRKPFTVIVISLLIIIYSIFLPFLSDTISLYSISAKIISVFLIIMPLGLLMGIPFPTGMKILGERNESLIPWAWAINGCLSVLAPILTIILAMAIGFKMVLWLGALNYIMAFITLQNFLRRSS